MSEKQRRVAAHVGTPEKVHGARVDAPLRTLCGKRIREDDVLAADVDTAPEGLIDCKACLRVLERRQTRELKRECEHVGEVTRAELEGGALERCNACKLVRIQISLVGRTRVVPSSWSKWRQMGTQKAVFRRLAEQIEAAVKELEK